MYKTSIYCHHRKKERKKKTNFEVTAIYVVTLQTIIIPRRVQTLLLILKFLDFVEVRNTYREAIT